MKIVSKTTKQSLLFVLTCLVLTSCKQSEFYDKSMVLGDENPGEVVTTIPPTGSSTNSGSDNNSTSTPGTSNPNTPVTTTPPVITIPSVVLNEKSEIFTQNKSRNGDVDILWVIDNSGSMADNQDSLARNFTNFIGPFIDRKIDFKMGITTTDGTINYNGRMVGDANKLTSSAAIANKNLFISNFQNWVRVGTMGSGVEQGLKTASSFLDRYSSSFLRSDAYLIIVILSDENDQSEKKVSEYISRFQSTKVNKGMVKAYSIVTQSLPKNAVWETVGTRYNEVSDATGGVKAEITDDYSTILRDMGTTIVNLIDKFALAESPYDNQVQVFVNNIEVQSGWVYDSLSKAIKFNSDSIPNEGAKIEVRYKVKASVLGAI